MLDADSMWNVRHREYVKITHREHVHLQFNTPVYHQHMPAQRDASLNSRVGATSEAVGIDGQPEALHLISGHARALFILFCWLLNVPATCECILGMDLLRQLYVLPCWDTSCRPNLLSHSVTVCWHRANQSQRWPRHARHLAGKPLECQFLSHWYDSTRTKIHAESKNWTRVCMCTGGLKIANWPKMKEMKRKKRKQRKMKKKMKHMSDKQLSIVKCPHTVSIIHRRQVAKQSPINPTPSDSRLNSPVLSYI